jgi:hypothetical protein
MNEWFLATSHLTCFKKYKKKTVSPILSAFYSFYKLKYKEVVPCIHCINNRFEKRVLIIECSFPKIILKKLSRLTT